MYLQSKTQMICARASINADTGASLFYISFAEAEYSTFPGFSLSSYTIPWAFIAVAQGLSVYAVFAFICILWAYYQRSPFRFYTILHRFRLSVNMQMNRIRFCLHIPHNTSVFRCRLCSNHNTVPMIRLALK